MSEEIGPRCTWHLRADRRMDVTVAHRDEFAVVNVMLCISRTYGRLAVIWAKPYEQAGQIVANGVVNLTIAQGAHAHQSPPP